MALSIQRVPRSLGQILSIFGGQTPQNLSDNVSGVVDLLQLYGAQQLQIRSAVNAATAEGTPVDITVPSTEHWVLFSATGSFTKTATQTALRGSILIGPDSSSMSACASSDLGPFGATETGPGRVVFYAPYPRLLFPGSIVRALLDILGTDATAVVSVTAQVGVLG